MKNNFTTVIYKDKKYIVAETNKNVPFVFDFEYLNKIDNRTFYKLANNYFGYTYGSKVLYLHHIVKPYNGISVDHINRNTQDNREINYKNLLFNLN